MEGGDKKGGIELVLRRKKQWGNRQCEKQGRHKS